MIDLQVQWPDGHAGRLTYLDRNDTGLGPLRAGYSAPLAQFTGWIPHHTVMVMPDYDRDGFLHGDLDDIARYMRVLQSARPDLGSEVPYSAVVFQGAGPFDVVMCEGRGPGRTGAHTPGYNSTRYAVAAAGNTEITPVTDGMVWGCRWLASVWTPNASSVTVDHQGTGYPTVCAGRQFRARLPPLHPHRHD